VPFTAESHTAAQTALRWAQTMTWKGQAPVVHLTDPLYQKGVRRAKRALEARLQRSATLPWRNILITPTAE
jgi:hypothetical protein